MPSLSMCAKSSTGGKISGRTPHNGEFCPDYSPAPPGIFSRSHLSILKRRQERLEERLQHELAGERLEDVLLDTADAEDFDEEDFTASELEDLETQLIDQATAAQTIAELRAEIATLKELEKMAHEVRVGGEDRKWEELSKLLQDNAHMFSPDGMRKKLIIFTEHRDTSIILWTRSDPSWVRTKQ